MGAITGMGLEGNKHHMSIKTQRKDRTCALRFERGDGTNRNVTWSDTVITFEADQRHVEICLKDVGVEETRKVVSTPIDRLSKDVRNRKVNVSATLEDELLTPSGAMKYRDVVARTNYLGQDRSEIQYSVKELGKEMSCPRQSSWTKMRKLLRYFKGVPRAVLSFGY